MSRRPPGIGSNSGGGSGAVTSVAGKTGVVTLASGDVVGDAPLASPTFTGTVTLPSGLALPANVSIPTTASAVTQSASDNSTKVATTAYADAIAALKAGLAGTVGGPAKIVRRTSDSSSLSNSNTLTSDDTLLVAVGASDVWWIELFASFVGTDGGGSASTADMKWGWSTPTGWTYKFGALGNLGSSVPGWGWTGAAASPLALNTSGGQTMGMVTAVEAGVAGAGIFVGDGSHTGNITLQWSQSVSNAATLVIKTNSFIRCTRIA